MANVKLYPTDSSTYEINVNSGATGPKGDTGATPQLTVDNTITGAPYTDANVTIGGPPENRALTFTIPQGNPFVIAAEYESVADLSLGQNANVTPSGYIPELFDFVIINTGSVENEENAQLYIYDGEGSKGGFTFVSDLSGATGPRRELRWKPDGSGGVTSIIQWKKDDGTWDEENERDLGLSVEFNSINNELVLEITNSDGVVKTTNLTATAEFGNGTDASTTSVRFNDNVGNSTAFQELGVYAEWNNTNLKIQNPNGIIVEGPDGKKLSPDIHFNTGSGVSISIVEPGVIPDPEDYNKISPDINFREGSNGLELSLVEPGAIEDYRKISPDIYWDSTKIAITEPGITPVTQDYQELGVYAQWGDTAETYKTLTITNPNGDVFSQDLGLEYNWDGTQLGIKAPGEEQFEYVDLKGATGDPLAENTVLFQIKDGSETPTSYDIKYNNEIQLTGVGGISVENNNGVFKIIQNYIDGGDFIDN